MVICMVLLKIFHHNVDWNFIYFVVNHKQGLSLLQSYGSWDLHLLIQSVPFTIKVMSLIPYNDKVYLIQHYVKSLSVTCHSSVVFSGYSSFPHR